MGSSENTAMVKSLGTTSPAPDNNVFWLSTVLFMWYLVTYVLLPIPAIRPAIDESWRAFLTWAFEHHKQFGIEVIFTYGPWGFLSGAEGNSQCLPVAGLGKAGIGDCGFFRDCAARRVLDPFSHGCAGSGPQ